MNSIAYNERQPIGNCSVECHLSRRFASLRNGCDKLIRLAIDKCPKSAFQIIDVQIRAFNINLALLKSCAVELSLMLSVSDYQPGALPSALASQFAPAAA